MKNIIIGTAGHVDHGKTCLIKALTGTDCDRLKEEKKRGITIENGFADLTIDDFNISIIDVPGHEKFIRNMLRGIGGIDLVLLVIGLDEGIMPQTKEHFDIIKMLGIKRGIIVYTKYDMVDDKDWIQLVKDDAKEMVKGSFMEGCDEIEVSSYDGYNIEELKNLIVSNIKSELLKDDSDILFRLPIDRVFNIDGFGTVVTGTLLEGTIHTGDELMIYPGMGIAKVRNIQVHNEKVDSAFAGQRTALNLQGIKKEELEKGIVLARPNSLEPTSMVDCELEIIADTERTVLNNSRVHFYSGATEVTAKIVLIDRESIGKNEKCYCQFRFEEEIAVRRNDRFIIRFFSPLETIGGGKILEVKPKKHKKNEDGLISSLEIKNHGTDKEVLEQVILERSREIIDKEKLSLKLRISPKYVEIYAEELKNEGRIISIGKGFVHIEYYNLAEKIACELLSNYHQKNQMSDGVLREEFRSQMEIKLGQTDRKALNDLIQVMMRRKIIKDIGNRVSLFDFVVKESKETTDLKNRIIKLYSESKYEMPTVEEVLSKEKDKNNVKHIIEALSLEGKLVRLDYQYYIDSEAYDKALILLKEKITDTGKITLAEFRDMLGTSRKYAMAILDYMDQEKITKKIDDYRIIY